MVLVSVIIPTYNRARYVTEAIDSVLAQTFSDYEIIVVDDGSTDNTREALKPYLGRIHYIYQSNKGVSAARNRGMRDAKGEWISFLDSDDIWLPRKLKQQVDDVCEIPSATGHVVNAQYCLGTGDTDLFRLRGLKLAKGHIDIIKEPFVHLLKYQYASLPSFMISRRVIEKVGELDDRLAICEDFHWLLKLSAFGPWAIRNEILAKFLRRDECDKISLTQAARNNELEKIKSSLYLYSDLKAFASRVPLTRYNRKLIAEKLSQAYFMYGVFLVSKKEVSIANQMVNEAVRTHLSISIMIKYFLNRTRIGRRYIQRRYGYES